MKVLTGGTFDLPHAGHINFLRQCRKIAGDGKVIVSLNSDRFIQEYKGKPPIMSYEERRKVLMSIRYVDEVVENIGGSDSKIIIAEVGPDFLVIGSDWAKKDYYKQMDFTQEWLDSLDISLVYVPYTEGVSTTQIKERVKLIPAFSAVIIAHNNFSSLEKCIDMIKEQTFKDVEIIVFYSDMPDLEKRPGIRYVNQPNKNDWGQEKCSNGLNSCLGEYVGFFNIDDEYESNYIEKMIKKARNEELDLVYCDFISKEGTTIFGQPKLNIGTRGMFVVRAEFGRSIGYNHRDYGADGRFLEELVEAGAKHARLEEILYRHK